MKINIQNLFILSVLGFFGVLASCVDPAKEKAEEEEQEFQDSLEQATIDDELIETYLANNGLNATSGDYGIRYVVTEEGTGETPEVNDIVSVHYTGKSIDDEVFDTSIESFAITIDSASWVEEWNDSDSEYFGMGNSFLNDTLSIIYIDEDELDSLVKLPLVGLETSEILATLNRTRYPLDLSLYSSTRNYNPITYNQVEDGTNLSLNSYIFGFKEGLDLLSSNLNIGAKGLIIFPSVVGYGSLELSEIIQPNSVLIFEFEVDAIRYQ